MSAVHDSGGYDSGPFVADFYDRVLPYANRDDIGYYVRACGERGGPVLELAAGTGRIAIPVARTGVRVVGLDASDNMLRVFRDRLTHETPSTRALIDARQGDMRDFDLGDEFPTIILPFNSFLLLQDVSEQLACLRCVRRHLARGGEFLFDVFNPSLTVLTSEEYLQEFAHEPEVTLPDGRRFVRCQRVVERDLANQTMESEIIYHVTDTQERQEKLVHRFRLRYLFRFELEHLLDRAGFQLDSLYGDFEAAPFGVDADRLLVVTARCKGT